MTFQRKKNGAPLAGERSPNDRRTKSYRQDLRVLRQDFVPHLIGLCPSVIELRSPSDGTSLFFSWRSVLDSVA